MTSQLEWVTHHLGHALPVLTANSRHGTLRIRPSSDWEHSVREMWKAVSSHQKHVQQGYHVVSLEIMSERKFVSLQDAPFIQDFHPTYVAEGGTFDLNPEMVPITTAMAYYIHAANVTIDKLKVFAEAIIRGTPLEDTEETLMRAEIVLRMILGHKQPLFDTHQELQLGVANGGMSEANIKKAADRVSALVGNVNLWRTMDNLRIKLGDIRHNVPRTDPRTEVLKKVQKFLAKNPGLLSSMAELQDVSDEVGYVLMAETIFNNR